MSVEYENPLGQWVREVRQKRKLSILELSARAGLGEWTINRLERGIGRPNLQTMAALFRVLGLPPRRILRGMDPDERGRVHAAMRLANGKEVRNGTRR